MPSTPPKINPVNSEQSEPENICTLYHGGTQSDAPFRHITNLDSAFVAQVLGQVLMDRQASEKPRYVEYRPIAMTAPLFDRKF